MRTILAILLCISPAFGQCPDGTCPPFSSPYLAPRPFAGGGGSATPANISGTVASQVVQVTTGRAGGSGVCVYAQDGQGVVLTARHVYEAAQDSVSVASGATRIVFPGGQSYTSSSVVNHPHADLAAVFFDYPASEKLPAAKISTDPPARGADIWKIGYPAVNGRAPMDVRTGRVIDPLARGQYLHASALIRSGDSGGGVYDAKGYLVGIAVMHEGDFQCRAVTTKTCYDFCYKTCFPRLRNWTRPAPKPQAPPSMPPATQPPAQQPPSVPGPAAPDYSGQLAQLIQSQQQILDRLMVLESKPGVPGPAGPQGPAGERGLPGPPGKNSDESRVQALESELAALRKRFKVELLDASGKVIQTDEFGHDRPLRIRLKPVE